MRSALRAVAGAAIAACTLAASAAVPTPTTTGPIASTAVPGDPSHNYIFFATDHPMAANGYVEEEYFLSGTASTYTTPTGATGTVATTGNPYKTRVIVRRPADPRSFNGTVLVEWTNVTNGFDAENVWFFAWEHIVRAGYAWVGVSAQHVGVDRLKTWNATRYGTLDVSLGGTLNNDALSYDIFSQAGQAARTGGGGVNILGNLHPKHVIAMGESQSAQRLSVYINSVMPLGHPYDGVLLQSTFGQGIRPDTTAPIFKVLFEWDVQTGEAAVRQADTALFRAWEVAGTAHVDYHLRLSREPNELRDLGTSSEAAAAPNCQVPNIGSRAPNHYVVDAAIEAMNNWVSRHQAPPTAPKMTIASYGPGNAAVIARDPFNIAEGGVRLSQIAVPIASNVGQNNGLNSGGGACPRWGYHLPFDLATLDSLYSSQLQYLLKVTSVSAENVKKGYLLAPDAAQTILDAAATRVGR